MSVAVTFPHGSYCEYSTCIGSTQVTCNMDAPVPVPVPTAYGMLVGDGLDSLRRIFTNVSRVAVVGSSGNLLFRAAPQIGAGIVASLFPHPSPSVAASAGGDGDVRSPSGNSVTGSLAWAIQLVRDAASLLGLAVLCIVAPLGACGLIRLHMRWPAQRRDRRWIQFEANYGEATEQDVAAAPHEGGE